ncbi:MAG TPA: PfkB family carbohydrate kinase [Acidimicrobiales bacterium]|nr:PfkB family carbohydrate kinase [Acidimicrobiales bacterium]
MLPQQPFHSPVITVFDPFPILTVTIEDRDEEDEIHLHAGGQGLWIGRMAVSLGACVRLVSARGGESGAVLARLIGDEGIEDRGVATTSDSAVYVHDRRSGGRDELAEVRPAPLPRHELDALYEQALIEACDADVFVLAGPRPGTSLPEGTYERLAADVGVVQPRIVADLCGDALREALAADTIQVLKLSDEELFASDLASGDAPGDVLAGIDRLREAGARNIVVTRGAEPTIALVDGALVEVVAPRFTPHDKRGGGDSMTAALAVGLARGDSLNEGLRLGAAAGALNVTRRGLASVQPDHVARLTERVTLRPVEPVNR